MIAIAASAIGGRTENHARSGRNATADQARVAGSDVMRSQKLLIAPVSQQNALRGHVLACGGEEVPAWPVRDIRAWIGSQRVLEAFPGQLDAGHAGRVSGDQLQLPAPPLLWAAASAARRDHAR